MRTRRAQDSIAQERRRDETPAEDRGGWLTPAKFSDRADAGRRLGAALERGALPHPFVVGLPRGGVPVAAAVAAALHAPLGIVLVRKLGVPGQPELAFGAWVDGDPPMTVLNDDVVRVARLGREDIERVVAREADEMAKRRRLFGPVDRPLDVAGRTVVVVDDGAATGATAVAAIRALRARSPARIIAAFPVASHAAVERLSREADAVYALMKDQLLRGVGGSYDDFAQVPNADVRRILEAYQAVN